MGIYIFKKEIIKYIPKNEKMDMPDLVITLQQAGKKIRCFSANGRCSTIQQRSQRQSRHAAGVKKPGQIKRW